MGLNSHLVTRKYSEGEIGKHQQILLKTFIMAEDLENDRKA
jgi:hypothetical protein